MGYEIDFLPVGDSNGDAICVRYGRQLILSSDSIGDDAKPASARPAMSKTKSAET
jgi:hypothetical protein